LNGRITAETPLCRRSLVNNVAPPPNTTAPGQFHTVGINAGEMAVLYGCNVVVLLSVVVQMKLLHCA